MTGSTLLDSPSGPGGLRAGQAYQRLAQGQGHVDELIGPDGAPRAGSQDLLARIDMLGLPTLLARRAEAARLVEDEGIVYGVPRPEDDSGRPPVRASERRWRVDPLPVVLDDATWRFLHRGLEQRAMLLDALLADVYGPRRLLRHDVLPAEAVLTNPQFVRQADAVLVPGPRQLFMHAADLVRTGEGTWQVLSDRTQAPSGAGYALQTRRVVARVMPALYRDTELIRLRSFFDSVRAALTEFAPPSSGIDGDETPRVVVLSPGSDSETAFDQAFLATLLGYPLVTGEDLTVRGGRVLMRSVGQYDPVDVVLRRVDTDYADPLELRAESQLGVPGLLEATRSGAVSVVNSFGAGFLESPALQAFWPELSQTLLGEPAALSGPQTWWCGLDAHRSHVLANLDDLVIKSADRREGLFGWELSSGRQEELRAQIEAEPHRWCGQEPLVMSTAPVVTGRGLEPRRFTLRTFAVAQQDGYQLMTGGLGRVAASADTMLVSNAKGALAKDVWVLAPEAAAAPSTGPLTLVGDVETIAPRPPVAAGLPPRVAENLFWLGRYAERAEDTVRLVRVVDELAEDWVTRPGTAGAAVVQVLTEATRRVTLTPDLPLLDLVADGALPGSVAYAVRRTVAAAQSLREQLSLDTWIVLGSLDRVLDDLADRAGAGSDDEEPALAPVLARVLEGLLALAGLGAESMIRDVGWHFMDAGRRIERCVQILSLLRHALDHPSGTGGAGRPVVLADEALVLEAVLTAGESIITHRRLRGRVRVESVLELLVQDRQNPRSVALQLDRLAEDLSRLPAATAAGRELGDRLLQVTARLREFDPSAAAAIEDGRRPHLGRQLDVLLGELFELSQAMEEIHFVHQAPSRPTPAIVGWTR